MCINGHYHTNHMELKDNILYFDVNTVMNGSWSPKTEHHYGKEHTFLLEDYDRYGNLIDKRVCALTELSQAVNTHYFAQPLSAIVKIEEDGVIEIVGSKTTWRYDVVPQNLNSGMMPEISDGNFILA